MFYSNYITYKIPKRKTLWKKKSTLIVLIFVNLLILIIGLEIIHIAELDKSLSLLRNYWFECVRGQEAPFMPYEDYLISCYKDNIFECFILVPIIWVAIVFFIDIIDDLVNFRNLKR